MLIRREQPGDVASVAQVVTAAFAAGPSTPVETRLLGALRADPGWLPWASLVATDAGGEVTGYVVCTRGRVGDVPALGLGPLAVVPRWQRRGVGAALMHAVLAAADARDEPFVALLGAPAFYSRFGFGPAAARGVQAPDPAWGAYFQVRPLTAYRPVEGTFRYAAPFAGL
ncbi:MAG TPA: N-acetyltransferase [Pilimelia sp.]|nr:N-acetyltransferase [Pilimelia sp.]